MEKLEKCAVVSTCRRTPGAEAVLQTDR